MHTTVFARKKGLFERERGCACVYLQTAMHNAVLLCAGIWHADVVVFVTNAAGVDAGGVHTRKVPGMDGGECVDCLFKNKGQWSRSCTLPSSVPSSLFCDREDGR